MEKETRRDIDKRNQLSKASFQQIRDDIDKHVDKLEEYFLNNLGIWFFYASQNASTSLKNASL